MNGTNRVQSVRYVAQPLEKKQQKRRTVSIRSDYSVGAVVTTDMTTLPPEDDDESNKPFVERSQSVNSKGPGWRANMKGDYDTATVKPIATKDLLCWAYQVKLFNYISWTC